VVAKAARTSDNESLGNRVNNRATGLRASPESLETIGKYVVLRRIGEGGMGTIYEARHAVLGHHVAIKVITTSTEGVFERFEREARATARLNSPHIATVIDLDTLPNGQPYMVMELLVGNDLAVEIGQHGRLPLESAVEYVAQALQGIAAAHAADIIHRDLKPSNIFLCKSTNAAARPVVKLLDFGIAKLAGDGSITATSDSFGTPDYMSPEQIRASRDVDARADLWSLGIVLYEALVGQAPFEGSAASVIASIVTNEVPPPSTRAPGIPPAINAIVARALRKNPDERFQTAEEFLDALAPFRPEPPSTRRAFVPPKALTDLLPLFGMILVELGKITARQLRQAIAIQEKEPTRRLGDILVAIGACTEADVRVALAKQRDSKPDYTQGMARQMAVPVRAPVQVATPSSLPSVSPSPQRSPSHAPARRHRDTSPWVPPVVVAPELGPARQQLPTYVIPRNSNARLWTGLAGLLAVILLGAGASLWRSSSGGASPSTPPIPSQMITPAASAVAPAAATSAAEETAAPPAPDPTPSSSAPTVAIGASQTSVPARVRKARPRATPGPRPSKPFSPSEL
jgi:hypothetical protein